MKKRSSTIVALGFYTTLFLGGVVGGCSGDKGGSTQGSRTVPRPVTSSDAGPANAIEDDCDPGDQCTGAASCQGVCGLHELGDRACMCTANALTCTACALNAEFRPMVQNATEFCPMGTDDDDPCLTKGTTCIDISYNNAGVAQREGCLCWQGRARLEWDCTANLNSFFMDMAPPTPAGPLRDGGVTPPPPPPATADAASATD